MKTIKQLEKPIEDEPFRSISRFQSGYYEALKDVLKLIDEKHKEAKDMCSCIDGVDGFLLRDDEVDEIFIELKSKIEG